MSAATVAAIAGVAAVGATAFSAVSASNSAADANATNAANVSNTNQLNYQEFLQSRGANGSAIYPIYASGAENQLYNDALSTYDATGAIQPTSADYQKIADNAAPGAAAATTAASNLFNGQTLNTELGQQQPVSEANLNLAQTQKQSSLESLQQTLNSIKAIQAGKGYAGDSFGNSLLRFNATAGANTAGAQAIAGAKLANARSVQGLQEQNINRQIQNPNAVGNAASQQVNLAQLPTNALAQQQVTRQNLFSNFKIGTQAFQYQNLPLVTPTAGTGQIAGQAVGSLANTAGNYFTNQTLQNNLTANANAFSTGSPIVSPSDVTSALNPNPANYNANDVIPQGESIAALSGGGL